MFRLQLKFGLRPNCQHKVNFGLQKQIWPYVKIKAKLTLWVVSCVVSCSMSSRHERSLLTDHRHSCANSVSSTTRSHRGMRLTSDRQCVNIALCVPTNTPTHSQLLHRSLCVPTHTRRLTTTTRQIMVQVLLQSADTASNTVYSGQTPVMTAAAWLSGNGLVSITSTS